MPILPGPHHLEAVSPVVVIKVGGVADHEIHRTPFWTGRTQLQKYLHLAQSYTCNRRRVAPGKSQTETQFFSVEVGGGTDIADGQARVVVLTVDVRGGGRGHKPSLCRREQT